jgi:ankyrin repeat protein
MPVITYMSKGLANACRYGNLAGVRYCIEYPPIDGNLGDLDEAMCIAAENGHFEIVKYLIENGSDISRLDDDRLFVHAESYDHIVIIMTLIKNGLSFYDTDNYALISSVANNDIEKVKYLVRLHGTQIIHEYSEYALCTSASRGFIDLVKYFVGQGANVHAFNEDALRLSAQNGHMEIVAFLIESGSRTYDIYDILRISAINGHLNITKILIDSGSDSGSDTNNYTSFERALAPFDIVKFLLENTHDDYDVNDDGDSKIPFEIIEYLLKNNMDITYYNNYILYIGKRENRLDIIKLLANSDTNLHNIYAYVKYHAQSECTDYMEFIMKFEYIYN